MLFISQGYFFYEVGIRSMQMLKPKPKIGDAMISISAFGEKVDVGGWRSKAVRFTRWEHRASSPRAAVALLSH